MNPGDLVVLAGNTQGIPDTYAVVYDIDELSVTCVLATDQLEHATHLDPIVDVNGLDAPLAVIVLTHADVHHTQILRVVAPLGMDIVHELIGCRYGTRSGAYRYGVHESTDPCDQRTIDISARIRAFRNDYSMPI